MPIKAVRNDEGGAPSGLVVLKPKRYEQKRGSDYKNMADRCDSERAWPSDVLIDNSCGPRSAGWNRELKASAWC